MPVFLFCEDNEGVREKFVREAWPCVRGELGCEWTLRAKNTFKSALEASKNIKDEDIISLDSQLPDQGQGEAIVTAVRQRGCRCLILWHSSVGCPDRTDVKDFRNDYWFEPQYLTSLRNAWSKERASTSPQNTGVTSVSVAERRALFRQTAMIPEHLCAAYLLLLAKERGAGIAEEELPGGAQRFWENVRREFQLFERTLRDLGEELVGVDGAEPWRQKEKIRTILSAVWYVKGEKVR